MATEIAVPNTPQAIGVSDFVSHVVKNSIIIHNKTPPNIMFFGDVMMSDELIALSDAGKVDAVYHTSTFFVIRCGETFYATNDKKCTFLDIPVPTDTSSSPWIVYEMKDYIAFHKPSAGSFLIVGDDLLPRQVPNIQKVITNKSPIMKTSYVSNLILLIIPGNKNSTSYLYFDARQLSSVDVEQVNLNTIPSNQTKNLKNVDVLKDGFLFLTNNKLLFWTWDIYGEDPVDDQLSQDQNRMLTNKEYFKMLNDTYADIVFSSEPIINITRKQIFIAYKNKDAWQIWVFPHENPTKTLEEYTKQRITAFHNDCQQGLMSSENIQHIEIITQPNN